MLGDNNAARKVRKVQDKVHKQVYKVMDHTVRMVHTEDMTVI